MRTIDTIEAYQSLLPETTPRPNIQEVVLIPQEGSSSKTLRKQAGWLAFVAKLLKRR